MSNVNAPAGPDPPPTRFFLPTLTYILLRSYSSSATTLVEIEGLEWNAATVVGDNAVVGVSNAPLEENDAATVEAAAAVYYATPSGDAEITGLRVGTSGSGADVIISSTSITAGEPVRLNSGFHEVPLDLA